VGAMQVILSGVMTLFFYALVFAAVWKLFQVATDLGEIKTMLSEMRRGIANPELKPIAAPASTPISLESAEALLREVAAESHALASAEPPKTR
jgi:hypothetical protein